MKPQVPVVIFQNKIQILSQKLMTKPSSSVVSYTKRRWSNEKLLLKNSKNLN